MHALVLGVNGLTGRAVALELARAGWDVVGTGRDEGRFPRDVAEAGVSFRRSDRYDAADLAEAVGGGADLVVDCLCYTAEHARMLLVHRERLGSGVVLSSKAVYVDAEGRHSNSGEPPDFGGPVSEEQPVLEPDFTGDFNGPAYGANKVAAELTLLETGWPVPLLRASRIHGVGGARPREWFVVRRLLDGRRSIPLAHRGATGNHPTAAANLARLVAVCADRPRGRILNAADPGAPTAADVVTAVAAAAGVEIEVVPLADDAPAFLGRNPWDTWPPFLLDTSAATELGYEPVGTYAQTVLPQVEWLLGLGDDQRRSLDDDPFFAGLFDYRLDDEGLAMAVGNGDGATVGLRSRGRPRSQ